MVVPARLPGSPACISPAAAQARPAVLQHSACSKEHTSAPQRYTHCLAPSALCARSAHRRGGAASAPRLRSASWRCSRSRRSSSAGVTPRPGWRAGAAAAAAAAAARSASSCASSACRPRERHIPRLSCSIMRLCCRGPVMRLGGARTAHRDRQEGAAACNSKLLPARGDLRASCMNGCMDAWMHKLGRRREWRSGRPP